MNLSFSSQAKRKNHGAYEERDAEVKEGRGSGVVKGLSIRENGGLGLGIDGQWPNEKNPFVEMHGNICTIRQRPIQKGTIRR